MRVDEQTGKEGGKSRVTDYLKNEVAERMFERFEVGPRELHQGLFIKQIKAGHSDQSLCSIAYEYTYIGPAQTARLGPRPLFILGPPDETHRFPRNHAKDQDDGS
jgi:hypothetical protein